MGHVMRCLTLADALKRHDVDSVFLHRDLPGNLASVIRERGFEVRLLDASADDASATAAVLGVLEQKPSWLVVDHYQLDRKWEASVRSFVGNVMVIDDLADREHDCALLLDQNLVAGMETRYDGKVPESATLLLGPRYAVLDSAYAEHHERARVRSGPVRRVLAFFGGGDNTALTLRAVEAFVEIARDDITFHLVVAGVGAKAIREKLEGRGNIQLHGRVPTLIPLIESADLFIGASGSTSWERLCLGLPSIIVTIAENQRPIAAELERHGLVRWVGDANEASKAAIQAALEDVIGSGIDAEWSRACLDVVDGKGVERVCESMLLSADTSLRVRPVSAEDKGRLLEWANDSVTRANAFNPAKITAEAHERWFSARLGNPLVARIYMVETLTGIPVAQVRFDRHVDRWVIDYSVVPHARGRGFGKRALELGLDELFRVEQSAVVTGEVKLTNVASCRVFESLGFTKTVKVDRAIYSKAATE